VFICDMGRGFRRHGGMCMIDELFGR
jgi:hypothetical protein